MTLRDTQIVALATSTDPYMTFGAIAARMGLSTATIGNVCRAAGIRRGAGRNLQFSMDTIAKAVVEQVQSGNGTYATVAAQFNCTQEWVRQIAIRCGVHKPVAPRVTRTERDGIINLYGSGTKITHIADAHGRSVTCVRKVVRDSGAWKGPAGDCKPWTDAEMNFLCEHYCTKDWSAARIGKHLGRNRNEVIGKAHRLGLGIHPDQLRITREGLLRRLHRVFELRRQGQTIDQIAADVGACSATVSNDIRRLRNLSGTIA